MPRRLLRSVHYGDVHFPYQDDAALEVLYAVTEDVKPDIVVCHGDLLDCYSISSFEKSLEERTSLGDEIDAAKAHLKRMNEIAPEADRLLIEGNHENRLTRQIRALAKKPEAFSILELPSVADAMRWERLLELDELGWDFESRRRLLFDRIILKHGSVVRKHSAYTAKGEYEKYGKSGISGHTHRRGVFEHRDYNGFHGWWEHGCLCDLDPDYAEDPNWQQGFLVVTWSDDRTIFSVEEVRIHNGAAIYQGKIYGDHSFKAVA